MSTPLSHPRGRGARTVARSMRHCDGAEAKHASVPLHRVRTGRHRSEEFFSTNSRPALRAATPRREPGSAWPQCRSVSGFGLMTTASAAGLLGSRRREMQRRPARQPEQPEHQGRPGVAPVTEPHGQRNGYDEVPADDRVQQPAPDLLGSVPAGPQRVCSSPNDDDPQRSPGPLHDMYPHRRRQGVGQAASSSVLLQQGCNPSGAEVYLADLSLQ